MITEPRNLKPHVCRDGVLPNAKTISIELAELNLRVTIAQVCGANQGPA